MDDGLTLLPKQVWSQLKIPYGDFRSKSALVVPPGGTTNSIFASFEYRGGMETAGLPRFLPSSEKSSGDARPENKT
jgi:hypothetical protein